MDDNWPFIVAIVAIVFVAMPAVILDYVHKWRKDSLKQKAMAQPDPQLAGELMHIAERLERRVRALEAILDDDSPEWRKAARRSSETYGGIE